MKTTHQAPIFTYHPAQGKLNALISIPHSGEIIPEEFKQFLIEDREKVSIDVDTAVDKLLDIQKLNEQGIGVICAHIHRACVDLNRSPDLAVLAWKENSMGQKIVTQDVNQEEIKYFLGKYHTPYFVFLKALIESLNENFEKPTIIDLHSMPSKATAYHLAITPDQKIERPDFCLSDINGLSCEKSFIENISKRLASHTYKVTNNDPYFGGHITRRIHELFPHVNNIQIEIKRGLYLDELTRELVQEKSNVLKNILTQELSLFCKDFIR